MISGSTSRVPNNTVRWRNLWTSAVAGAGWPNVPPTWSTTSSQTCRFAVSAVMFLTRAAVISETTDQTAADDRNQRA